MPNTAVKKKSIRKGLEVHKKIVIDEPLGLAFETEDELYQHFLPQIETLEKEYFKARKESDIQDEHFEDYEQLLNQVLDDPDEIWEDAVRIGEQRVYSYVGHFRVGDESVYYVALAYRSGELPTFIFLHFPSRDLQLVDKFRRGNMIFDRVIKEVEAGAVDGDALSEGDDLAVGLYKAMLTVRSDKDISEDEFKNFEQLRETTIEDPDEIWRTNDLSGNVLVSFVKDFSDQLGEDNHYIVVTIEDTASSSHALLFSFPTKDLNLVDRYRHGENLQAEEVVQESSH